MTQDEYIIHNQQLRLECLKETLKYIEYVTFNEKEENRNAFTPDMIIDVANKFHKFTTNA